MKESTHKKLDKKLEKLSQRVVKLIDVIESLNTDVIAIKDALEEACEEHNIKK